MASVVDICNLALSRLGDEASVTSIDPPEGSAQSEHCAHWYPLSRDKALAAFPWSFALKSKRLAKLSTKPIGFEYAFTVPADSLKIFDVFAESDFDQEIEYRVQLGDQGLILVTNTDEICVRYITHQTNPSLYSPSFVDALAWLLASDLAGPIHTGSSGVSIATKCYEAYLVALKKAQTEDATQQMIIDRVVPSMIGDYYGE